MSETLYTLIPPRTSYFNEDPRGKLTDVEQALYDEVLAHFAQEGYQLPGEEKADLTEKDKMWLSRECLLRYLRASKWIASVAIKRLEETLVWRREYGLHSFITTEYIEPEAVTGKQVIFGYDTCGRPAFYLYPTRQNTDDPVKQNQHAVWMLERGIELMPPGTETVDLLIDFAARASSTSFSQSKDFLHILQTHYPERLGLALLINVPFIVKTFLRLIMPFVDPNTRVKIKLNPEVVNDKIFEADQVMSFWGGNREFEYEHEKYWPEFIKQCDANAARFTANWKALGGGVGVSEWAYKSGTSSVSEKVLNEKAGDVVVVNEVVDPENAVAEKIAGQEQVPQHAIVVEERR